MSQSRIASALEAKANLAVGFLLSLVIWQTIGPLFGYEVEIHDNLAITSIFTVASFARSYCMRRLFNYLTVRTSK